MEWLRSLDPTVQDVLAAFGRAILLILPIFAPVPVIIWYERRLLSWMQDRIGPNRTGNITFSRTSKAVPGFLKGKKFRLFGLLQSIADGLKLFLKEDIMPTKTDRLLFIVAPFIALFVSFTLGATIPFGPDLRFSPVADVNIGLLYVLAISSIGAYGLVLAGYSSNNKYSLLGGLRASAQLISYELAMGVSLASIVMLTGSLKLTEIVNQQQNSPLLGLDLPILRSIANWNIFNPMGFVSAAVFLICMLAETNRPPFDLPEAENELVAGYHTEYSTKRWAMFMMAEYMAIFVFSMVWFTVFMGGYHLLPIRWEFIDQIEKSYGFILGPLSLMVKGAFGISVFIWIRATFPRLRYDQLMNLGWKFLLPLSVANLIISASYIFGTRVYGSAVGWGIALIGYGILGIVWLRTRQKKKEEKQFGTRTIDYVVSSVKTQPTEPVAEVVQ
jgi:NADH-quinone oxidoreductase subunit H